MSYIQTVIVAQIVTITFILWPVFRVVRKAGYSVRYAWTLCILCAGCSFAMSGLGIVAAENNWLQGVGHEALSDLILLGVLQFALSPFTFCVLPLVYFSFQKWPLETRGKEEDIFE